MGENCGDGEVWRSGLVLSCLPREGWGDFYAQGDGPLLHFWAKVDDGLQPPSCFVAYPCSEFGFASWLVVEHGEDFGC